jgi:hypothetical protein
MTMTHEKRIRRATPAPRQRPLTALQQARLERRIKYGLMGGFMLVLESPLREALAELAVRAVQYDRVGTGEGDHLTELAASANDFAAALRRHDEGDR